LNLRNIPSASPVTWFGQTSAKEFFALKTKCQKIRKKKGNEKRPKENGRTEKQKKEETKKRLRGEIEGRMKKMKTKKDQKKTEGRRNGKKRKQKKD